MGQKQSNSFRFLALVASAFSMSGCSVVVRALQVNAAHSSSLSYDSRPVADAIYGQSDYASNAGVTFGVYYPFQPVFAGGKLFLVDSYQSRVLIWNTPPTSSTTPPDVVLGQPNNNFADKNGTIYQGIRGGTAAQVLASGMNWPQGVASDGTHLVVADTNNHRLLFWNTIPTVTGTPADFEIGQPSLTSPTLANNGGISNASLSSPSSLFISGGKLYVADTGNNRVLFWNTFPTAKVGADGVLGQPDFVSNTANNGGISATTLNGPRGLTVFGGKFLIADRVNNRVLVWASATPTSLSAASYALGQANTASSAANSGGVSAHSLNFPFGIDVIGTSLFVSDQSNNRVLVWNSLPTVWTTNADFIIGQSVATGKTANSGGRSANSLNGPVGIASDGTSLYLADSSNNRMVIYNPIPTMTNPAATSVWGQTAMNLGTPYGGGSSPNMTVNHSAFMQSDGSHFWVSDFRSNRMLRFPLGHTPFDGSTPDLVLGQTNLGTTDGGTTANLMSQPLGLATDGTRFYVADRLNSRILVWNSLSTLNGQAASFAIGQPNLTTATANNGGISAGSLYWPSHLTIDAGKLIVADSVNNRVLIWNTLPTANVAADVVLGQPLATQNTVNNGGVSGGSMAAPFCVHVFAGKLFVCDEFNHRILVWNSVPTSTVPADYVLGQTDLTGGTFDAGRPAVNAGGFNYPVDVAYNGNKFFVADSGNNRVLVYNHLPPASGTLADSVYGQLDLTSADKNSGGFSSRSIYNPFGLLLDGLDLWIADNYNSRILRFSDADR
jgi:hypothetical protein